MPHLSADMFASKKRGRDEDEYDILELDHASKVMVSSPFVAYTVGALLLIAFAETRKAMHSTIPNFAKYKACTGILSITTPATSTTLYADNHTCRVIRRGKLTALRTRS